MIHSTVYNTSHLFSKKGISKVVLSPGSRNAPLTISFARHPQLEVYNVIDERSAAFIALGMAQKLREPVVLCCTSGTALLNYAPAIAEAHYQLIPLIVLSADRPAEWQGQRDGQTIHQPHSVQNFVKRTFELPVDLHVKQAEWDYVNKLNAAVNLATNEPQGPVHINIPFREPFYPAANDHLEFDDNIKIIEPVIVNNTYNFSQLIAEWNTYNKRLVVAGQSSFDAKLNYGLSALNEEAVVVADIISNVESGSAIRHQDLFLNEPNEALSERLQAELLVTFGKSIISKNLKHFLRRNPPKAHWHFDTSMIQANTFQSMTRLIKADVSDFLVAVNHQEEENDEFKLQVRRNYHHNWKVTNEQTREALPEILETAEFCEFVAFDQVLKGLPAEIDLHLANSMPVRYANFIQDLPEGVEVFCNRGTSGIDGTNGTAVGNALVSDRTTVLMTGDLSFFYDRNAFFHHYDLSKLKIVVFNNYGGGIFRLISGPASLPELDRHFETRHNHSARFTALEFGFDYYKADDDTSLKKALPQIFETSQAPQLLEIFTKPEVNQKMYQWIKKQIND